MQITKADIALYADFTVNISDQKVNFQIKDAGMMDVAPVITEERYDALMALPQEPEEGESAEVTALRALYLKIVPFWCMCAYKRIVAFHGIDVTQAGLTTPRGDNYEPVSDKRRGEILGAIRSKVTFYQNKLEAYMKANDLLPIEDACCAPPRKRGQFGFGVARKTIPGCRPEVQPPYKPPIEEPEIPELYGFPYSFPFALG